MIRHKLIVNLAKLDNFEKYIVEYLTKKNIDWFVDENNTDESVRRVLYGAWLNYFGHTPEDGVHPFNLVWCKIADGINIDALISQTDLYGHDYQLLAETLNDLYMSEYRPTILIILKAFAERDFEELCNRYSWDINDGITIKSIQEDIENYVEPIVNNLDEDDLASIINFCGKPLPNLNS